MADITKITEWNILDYLKTDEARVEYLRALLEEDVDDPFESEEQRLKFIAHGLIDIAESLGICMFTSDRFE